MLVCVSVSTFEKERIMTYALHAIEHYMNPTRSLQNNREQSQKWNVRD